VSRDRFEFLEDSLAEGSTLITPDLACGLSTELDRNGENMQMKELVNACQGAREASLA